MNFEGSSFVKTLAAFGINANATESLIQNITRIVNPGDHADLRALIF